ncbi:hypothetical protein D3C71_1487690 [compost metagenome]
MIEADVLHHVIALGIGHRIVGFTQVPLAGEIGFVTAGLEHRGQGPFSGGQTTALTLKGHGGHAAAIGDAPGLHGGSPRRTTRLRVEGIKGCTLSGQFVDAGCRHASTDPATVWPKITVAGIVGHDEQDIGLFCLCCLGHTVERYQ